MKSSTAGFTGKFFKVCIVLSVATVLAYAYGLSPSVQSEREAPPVEMVEAETEPRSAAALRPQEQPPIEVRVETIEPEILQPNPGVEERMEDPEDRADPVARAQRDYEERNLASMRNPGVIPE